MRTTLDIDRDLLERAKTALGANSYTEAIERSLSRVVEQAEVDALLNSLRGEDLVWSLEELRTWRRARLRGDLLDGATSDPTAPADEAYFDGLRDRVRRRKQV